MRKTTIPRVRDLNPLKLLSVNTKIAYERLPGYDSRNVSPFSASSLKKYRWRSPSPGADRFPFVKVKMSLSRLVTLAVTIALFLSLLAIGGYRGQQQMKHKKPPPREGYHWEHFPRFVARNPPEVENPLTTYFQTERLLQWTRDRCTVQELDTRTTGCQCVF